MANGRAGRLIKRIRTEILVALKMLYPAPLQAEQLVIVTSHQSLTKGLQSKVDASQEIGQLDVDKRNITDRTGYELRVSIS